MKYCGIKEDFKTENSVPLLHHAVICNCFDIVCFLLEECMGVNVTDGDSLQAPLHLAYLTGHKQIAEYMIQLDAE